MIVPPLALQKIGDMSSADGEVELYHNGSELVGSVDFGTVTTVLISGKFPKWRDVFPDASTEPHAVDRRKLMAATKAAAVVTSEQSKGVLYDFGDSLVLTGKSSEYGESKVRCDVVHAGTSCKVKMDPRFVIEYLHGLPSDEEPNVSIHTTGPGGAVTLTCGEYRGVIMPLSEDA